MFVVTEVSNHESILQQFFNLFFFFFSIGRVRQWFTELCKTRGIQWNSTGESTEVFVTWNCQNKPLWVRVRQLKHFLLRVCSLSISTFPQKQENKRERWPFMTLSLNEGRCYPGTTTNLLILNLKLIVLWKKRNQLRLQRGRRKHNWSVFFTTNPAAGPDVRDVRSAPAEWEGRDLSQGSLLLYIRQQLRDALF